MQMVMPLKHSGNEEICFFERAGRLSFFLFFCILVCLPKGTKTEMGFCGIVHRVPFCAGLLPPGLCAPPHPRHHLFPSLLLYAGSLFVKGHMFHGGRKCPREKDGRARVQEREGGADTDLSRWWMGCAGPRGREGENGGRDRKRLEKQEKVTPANVTAAFS